MTADCVVRARIDGLVKQQATDVLGEMGLSVSDGIRMLMVRIAREKALPFEVKVPNVATAARALSGDWSGFRESHLRPDLLLIYDQTEMDELRLVRMGSQSKLFG